MSPCLLNCQLHPSLFFEKRTSTYVQKTEEKTHPDKKRLLILKQIKMIRQIGKVVARGAAGSSARQISRPLARSMSGLEGREKAEEKRYFAQLEAERVASARAKFEEILASEDTDAKEDMMEILGTCRDISPFIIFFFLRAALDFVHTNSSCFCLVFILLLQSRRRTRELLAS